MGAVRAQQPLHQWLGRAEGLPDGFVLSITEDRAGHIWFGTKDGGAVRYDGMHMRTYTVHDGLPYNDVRTVFEDRDGHLWFATCGGGVARMVPGGFEVFNTDSGLSNNCVYDIAQTPDGHMWFATWRKGLCRFDGDRFEVFDREHGLFDMVISLHTDAHGRLWVGGHGGLAVITGDLVRVFGPEDGYDQQPVWGLAEEAGGRMLFATMHGVYAMDTATMTISTVLACTPEMNSLLRMAVAPNGDIWVGTAPDRGVVRIRDGQVTHYDDRVGLPRFSVWAVHADRNGTVWVGSGGLGVLRMREPDLVQFPQTASSGPIGPVMAVLPDGRLLVSRLEPVDMQVLQGDSVTPVPLPKGAPKVFMGGMAASGKGMVLCQFKATASPAPPEAGYYLLLPDGGHRLLARAGDGFSCDPVCTFSDSRGRAWFGHWYSGGATWTDGTSVHIFKGITGGDVMSIAEDAQGRMYFAGHQMVWVFDGDSLQRVITKADGLADVSTRALLIDRSGLQWFGHGKGFGISVHDPVSGRWRYLTTADGLMSMGVEYLHQTADGTVWVATTNGINRIRAQGIDSISVIPTPSTFSLEGMHCDRIVSDSTGYLFISTRSNGVIRFRMADIRQQETPPRLMLTGLTVNYEDRPLRAIDADFTYLENILWFHFMGIDHYAPHKVRYSTYLEGLDTDWSPFSSETVAKYSGLRPGRYTLRIRAMNEMGVLAEPLELRFTVHPPWWLTWWAYAAYALLLVASVVFIVWYNRRRLVARAIELQTQVDRATVVIRDQRDKVEKQNREILESINYAKRIQESILVPEPSIREHVPDFFLLYRPRDIVSGDFYWFHREEGLTVFVCADCTGHGVPGAFLSMVGSTLLNEIVKGRGVHDPAQIMRELSVGLSNALSRREQERLNTDGMDIGICTLGSGNLRFAGANTSMYVVDSEGLREIESQVMSINGIFGLDEEEHITSIEVPIASGGIFYMSTDGYVDQVGEQTGKKLFPARFEKLLEEIHGLAADAQKQRMEEYFLTWKGAVKQFDDVLVIGVRV